MMKNLANFASWRETSFSFLQRRQWREKNWLAVPTYIFLKKRVALENQSVIIDWLTGGAITGGTPVPLSRWPRGESRQGA